MSNNAPKASDVLVYIGGATVRRITSDQWAAAGITGQGTITWSKASNRRCKVGDLTPEAFELLMENHSNEFRVLESNEVDQNTGRPVTEQSTTPHSN